MNSPLAQRQQELLAYLQGQLPLKEASIRHHIVEQGQVDIEKRLSIYQNAYRLRLEETIDTDHNILGRYLGDELYEKMMNEYILNHPSQHFSLRHFADDLPQFLATQAIFNEHPQIAELARFERLLLSAFDAFESSRADTAQLKSLDTQQWPNICLRFHPSVQLFESEWNAVSIWQSLKQDKVPPDPYLHQNAWLVWRNTERLTEFRPLEPFACSMLKHFQQGHNFSQVCEALLAILPEKKISEVAVGVLVAWLDLGIVHGIKTN